MAAKNKLPIPVARAMRKLGTDIGNARRRRRITAKLLAERAGVSPRTMAKIEKGDASVTIASYASVLFSLGMVDRLSDLVDSRHDVRGRELEEEHLPKRVRVPKNNNDSKKS
ncbi:MAG: helix-turn-helix domain-containing protein [Verrucomicrobiae bacterium]|nr:helix-turn-helix domain-containing protein [Verrucomicrobiae bacterium]NNJ85838.1 helix-turn-helix domain-containing protein [Akkermansiaceae bacterium]